MTNIKNNKHDIYRDERDEVIIAINPSDKSFKSKLLRAMIKNMNRAKNDRSTWDGKLQFFLSIIGYSIGLGNIWRFPYLCQQHGGGAFLIAYFIMLLLEGIPLFLIELGLGQRMRQSALGVWKTIHPWLGGIGIASTYITFFVNIRYSIIISWCIFYLLKSLQAIGKLFCSDKDQDMSATLPWSECPINITTGNPVDECTKSSSTAYFWYRVALDGTPSFPYRDEAFNIKWWLVVCLFCSWLFVFYVMMKGIKSSGNIIFFTSIFPYMVLTVFFIKGITLEGADIGLAHMYTPQLKKLLEPKVWLDAATQVFYSFGAAFGTLIAFGSYNQPNNNCVRDVILVSICNVFTAVFASSVVFTILGFKAVTNVAKCLEGNKNLLVINGLLSNLNSTENDYERAVTSYMNNSASFNFTLQECSVTEQLNTAAEGTGLAFLVFPEAILQLPNAPFWSFTFFLMLLSIGLGSLIGLLEGLFCVFFEIDCVKLFKKQYITGLACILHFCIGVQFCSGIGEYWMELYDSFAGTIGLGLVAFIEMIAVGYIYGHERFSQDIENMTGYRPGIYWQVTWRFIAPFIMGCIICSNVISMIIKKPQYYAWDLSRGTTIPIDYPNWVFAYGIFVVIMISVAPILGIFLLRRFKCSLFNDDIHHSSIRRIDTTVSTKKMMVDAGVDLNEYQYRLKYFSKKNEDKESNDDDDDASVEKNVKHNYSKNTFKIESINLSVFTFKCFGRSEN